MGKWEWRKRNAESHLPSHHCSIRHPLFSIACIQTVEQPCTRKRPPPRRCRAGDAQDVGRFGLGESGEVAELDELGFVGGLLGEGVEGFVEGEQAFVVVGFDGGVRVEQVDALEFAAVFEALFATSVFDKDTAHGLSRCGEEVAT